MHADEMGLGDTPLAAPSFPAPSLPAPAVSASPFADPAVQSSSHLFDPQRFAHGFNVDGLLDE